MKRFGVLISFLFILFCSTGFAEGKKVYVDLQAVEFPETPLHEKFGRWGDYFYANIPDGEDKNLHIELLNEIIKTYKEINGAEFNNPALLCGMNLKQLTEKVLKPAKMILSGQILPEYSYNLIFVIAENSTNGTAFDNNYKFPFFVKKEFQDGFEKYVFEEAFFEHYDCIFIIQPNGKIKFDQVMDVTVPQIEKILGVNNCTDLIYMAHGTGKAARFSSSGKYDDILMNLQDFKPVEQGGNIYAESLKNIFTREMNETGYSRIISLGCESDFIQDCIDLLMGENSFFVKVFGTPYKTHGLFSIGFTNRHLEMYANVSPYQNIFALKILLIEGKAPQTVEKVDTFLFSKNNLVDKIVSEHKEGKKFGKVKKWNGVYMEYMWIDCAE